MTLPASVPGAEARRHRVGAPRPGVGNRARPAPCSHAIPGLPGRVAGAGPDSTGTGDPRPRPAGQRTGARRAGSARRPESSCHPIRQPGTARRPRGPPGSRRWPDRRLRTTRRGHRQSGPSAPGCAGSRGGQAGLGPARPTGERIGAGSAAISPAASGGPVRDKVVGIAEGGPIDDQVPAGLLHPDVARRLGLRDQDVAVGAVLPLPGGHRQEGRPSGPLQGRGEPGVGPPAPDPDGPGLPLQAGQDLP